MYSRVMNLELIAIPIIHVLKHQHLFEGIEAHILVNDKHIKLNYADESYQESLEKLSAKGVVHIYIAKTEFNNVMLQLQNRMANNKFYDPLTTEELRASTCNTVHELSKAYINRLGATPEVLEMMKDANQKMQKILDQSPGIFAFVKRFKANCSEEYLKISVTNLVLTMTLNKFPWKSQLIVQKSMMASLLCDITMNSKSFDALYHYQSHGGELEDEVARHPMLASEILNRKRDLIPSETITIIEQHHERPDGKGFPNGITTTRFNQLSAVFIVCQRFVDLLFKNDFDHKQHNEMIRELQMVYQGGHFDKAMDALISVVESAEST
jgi:response regulator RpfG family c-di-GMP phosphodiesterase